MKENISIYGNQQLKSSSEFKQEIPSSFSINSEYFTLRLVRIKEKIDGLIKQCIRPNVSGTNQKTQSIKEDQTVGSMTSRTMTDSYGRARNQIPVQKITTQTKQQIQNIYNQIHALEVVATKDEHSIETNTFELRSFLKDLRNQNKRLARILPDGILFELEKQKKQPFKKSQIIVQQIDPIIEALETASEKEKYVTEQKNLEIAKQLIDQTFNRRRIFQETQKYYHDQEDNKCKLFQCQII